MAFSFEQWVENVRQKPEAVRLRYVFVCVAVVMVLVTGLWLLTVSESFRSAAEETAETAESVNTLLPKPTDLSLDALLKSNQPLGAGQEQISGEQYFEGQAGNKTRPYFDEGVVPVPDKEEGQ